MKADRFEYACDGRDLATMNAICIVSQSERDYEDASLGRNASIIAESNAI